MERVIRIAVLLVAVCFVGGLMYGAQGCGHDDNLSLIPDTGAGADGGIDGDGAGEGECPDCICDCGDDCCDDGDITVTCDCEATATAECDCCDCCKDKDEECVPTHDVEANCENGIDEDCDGLIDCDDSDCDQNPICCETDVDSDCDGISDGCDDCPEMYNPEQEGCPEFCDDAYFVMICHRESEEDPGVTLCVPYDCACCDDENGADSLAKTSEILIPECDAHEMHEYDTYGDCETADHLRLKDFCNPAY